MSRFSRWMLAIALITAMIPFHALANATVCYGDLTDVCTPPADLTVQQGGDIALPGNLFVDADGAEERLAISVELSSGAAFARSPTAISATISTFTPRLLIAAGDGPFALSGISVRGTYRPDADIVAHVMLIARDDFTTLWEGDIVLAHVAPATVGEIYFVNPAANSTQETFIRVTNIGDGTALVLLQPIDDSGAAGGEVAFFLGAGSSRQLNSSDMERGAQEKFIVGAFGKPLLGKWRVRIVSDERIRWQAYVRNNNTGTLSALSDVTP